MPESTITLIPGGKIVVTKTVLTTTETRFIPDNAPANPVDPPVEPSVPDNYVRQISVDGTGDGRASPAPITALNEMIKAAGPGGTIKFLKGDYHLAAPLLIDAGGVINKRVIITGEPGTRLIGDRFDWDGKPVNVSGKKVGMNCFNFGPNANHLEFSGFEVADFGRVFNVDKNRLKDWVLNDLRGVNMRSFLYLDGSAIDSESHYGAIDGLASDGISVRGFSKDAMRIYGFSKKWRVQNFIFDSAKQDGDNFCIGIHVSGKAKGVRLENGSISNCVQTNKPGYKYWNGDGVAAERKCSNLVFTDLNVSDCSDGGFDIKAPGTLITGCKVLRCKRSYRLWDMTIALRSSLSAHPKKLGGTGGTAHVWLDANSIPKGQEPDLSTVTIEGAPSEKTSR